ncbi:MAG: hypothetical protein HOK67_21265 [Deltaproteobacteria bacterium]|jgi:hypothetical protein|nr:hypothetical protein [Deltaproteobacteria bacterium]
MKRAIIILAITLLPTVALGWDNRDFYDGERNMQLERIANEMDRAQEYREYRDDKADYEASIRSRPEYIQPMIRHYNPGPQPPKR